MVKFFEFLFSIYIDFILNLHKLKYCKSIIKVNLTYFYFEFA